MSGNPLRSADATALTPSRPPGTPGGSAMCSVKSGARISSTTSRRPCEKTSTGIRRAIALFCSDDIRFSFRLPIGSHWLRDRPLGPGSATREWRDVKASRRACHIDTHPQRDSPAVAFWLHRFESLDPLLDRRVGVEEPVEEARGILERVCDVERSGRLVGDLERLLVGGDLP